MKQIIQDLKNGDTILQEVPAPMVKPGQVLIQTTCSLVSLGTERMLVEFGRGNWIQKARQQPDKVKMVVNKVKTDGLKPTMDAVFNKLGQPLPLGYCNVGKVIGVGKGVTEFSIGDRVASNGNHAEIVSVPKNLVARIPDNVGDDEAAFTVIGSIGLQGIRLAKPTLGETVVVIGLGLIGQITAQLLKANGCKVVGFDFDDQKIEIARQKKIIAVNLSDGTDPVKYIQNATDGIGADAVLITASNKSNEIISQAANMSRKRGRIVLVGVIGLDISRADFYEKELTFQVSCSYGPGRYDDDYEEKGQDYPLAYVRWTEKRNFEAILNAISESQIDVKPLITNRVNLIDYEKIYNNIDDGKTIASLLIYESETQLADVRRIVLDNKVYKGQKGVVGIIGAGNFTSAMILPALRKANANIKMIASSGGLSGTVMAKKFGISQSTTDYNEILNDDEIDLVLVTTRHSMHASMVIQALNAGKHVFVEKPLALNHQELTDIESAYKSSGKTLVVGFNRRFAPLAQKMKSLLGSGEIPLNIVATMNAGFIPFDNWIQDMEVGGGRVIGEACHYFDICTFLAGSRIKAVCMNSMGVNADENTDNVSILLQYENGTNAVVNYFANGNKSYPKERIEVHGQERSLVLENWRKLRGYGFKGFSSASSSQDKGHNHQFALLMERFRKGGEPIIPYEDIINTTQATFAAIESFKNGSWVNL